MSFVPIVTVIPPAPSRRSRELGERIRSTIDDYVRFEPDATPEDIRQALELARPAAGSWHTAAAVAVLAGVMALLGVLFFVRAGTLGQVPWNFVVLGAIAVIGLLVVVARARPGGH